MIWILIGVGVAVLVGGVYWLGLKDEAVRRRRSPAALREAREAMARGDRQAAQGLLHAALFLPAGDRYSPEEARTVRDSLRLLRECIEEIGGELGPLDGLILDVERCGREGAQIPRKGLQAIKAGYLEEHARILAARLERGQPLDEVLVGSLQAHGWELESAVERHRHHPDTFSIPGEAERAAIEVGHRAKLLFLLAGRGTAETVECERMWVKVIERTPGGYVGVLESRPETSRRIQPGDRIAFGPDHVAATEIPRGSPSHPESPEIQVLVSHAYEVLLEGEYASAARTLDEVIERTSGSFEAYVYRAAARTSLGEHLGAIDDLTESIVLEPEQYLPYYSRARALSSLGRREEAMRDLNMCLRLEPGFADAVALAAQLRDGPG